MFIFVSSIKLNQWTSCDLVFLVLLWVVIIYIFKKRVQETDRVVERNLFSAVCENQTSSAVVITYKLPFILYTWCWFKKTLDIILRVGQSCVKDLKMSWTTLLSLEKQKKKKTKKCERNYLKAGKILIFLIKHSFLCALKDDQRSFSHTLTASILPASSLYSVENNRLKRLNYCSYTGLGHLTEHFIFQGRFSSA